MSKLVTPDGQILIPGIKELIAPVTDDERQKFEAIHFEMKVSYPDCARDWAKLAPLFRTSMMPLVVKSPFTTTPSRP